MNFQTYLKILTTVGLKRLITSFISIFGSLWLLTEPVGLFFPNTLNFGWLGYFALILISLIFAIILRFPKRSVSKQLPAPNSTIEIKIGDLFGEKGHLVVGVNDVFDTELGEVIAPSSVQGQFLSILYSNDQSRLDTDIEKALENHQSQRKEDTGKTRGKRWRYPIGTTLALGTHEKRYFLTAYGYMGNDLKIQSNADYIWLSLSSLWEQVRLKGHGMQVSIPIIGSTLARTNLPRLTLAKLIITSFVIASKQEFITQKLTLIISPKDIDFINLYDLEDFLETALF
jgi:hypothetical protein